MFDWSEYLSLAEELVEKSSLAASEESRLRSAMSRAYYSAFCTARNHLRDQEGHAIPTDGKVHSYVLDEFMNSTDKTWNRIGIRLDQLRIDRNKADYNDQIPKLAPQAKMDVKLAQKVLTELAGI